MINVERLTSANFQTHNVVVVVVVTALSTLCIAVLLQNSLCLRDFRVFVNFYARTRVCMCVGVCVGSQQRGAVVINQYNVILKGTLNPQSHQFHASAALWPTFTQHFSSWHPPGMYATRTAEQLHKHSHTHHVGFWVLFPMIFSSGILPGNPGNGNTCQRVVCVLAKCHLGREF